MPVQSWGHVQYWEFSDTNVAPVFVPHPDYPIWQASVILGGGAGGLQTFWDRLVFCWRWLRTIWRWTPEQRGVASEGLTIWLAASNDQRIVLRHTVKTLQHPAWPEAKQAVKQTAQTLGFNKSVAWANLSHTLHRHHDWAENSWRHLNAMHLLDQTGGSTMTNPERNLLTELGYVWFAATKGRE